MSDPSLEAQVQNLEARLRAAEEKATALATRNYELRVENDALRDENARLRADLDTIAMVQQEQQDRTNVRREYFIGEVA